MAGVEKKRRPWLAALLSLLIPGLGQLYNGQLRRALWFMLVPATEFVAFAMYPAAATTFGLLTGLIAFGLLLNALRLACAIDAFRQSRRIRSLALRRFNRWYVYAGVYLPILAMGVIATAILPHSYPLDVVRPSFSASRSMAPTLPKGERYYVVMKAFDDRPPTRGSVITFVFPGRDEVWIKRLVGLPGDRVQMRGGRLFINDGPASRQPLGDYEIRLVDGETLSLTRYRETLPGGCVHDILEHSDQEMLDDTPEYRVPPGHFFVLGDNRDNSLDSRVSQMGFVPMENLVGRATFRIWSDDWNRIGMAVE